MNTKDDKSKTKKAAKSKTATKKKSASSKKEDAEKKKSPIPKEWKEDKDSSRKEELDKGQRRSLISTLKRSISIRGGKKEPTTTVEAMNLVVTLSPTKHQDIIEYIDENVPSGGRAEWVRDSIRLKMRIERGIYGLNTGGQESNQKDTEEMMQNVFGQFAEVMTKVMTDLKSTASDGGRMVAPTRETRAPRIRPEREATAGPPKLKKIETDKKEQPDIKPDRPSLDDAMGSIIVVE